MKLRQDEIDRYNRQMLLDGWGEDGERRLKGSTVFIAGAGGLGSAAAVYLAVAGVGRLRICDMDTLEPSNLNRQILHDHTRIGVNKSVSARQTLSLVNPHVEVAVLTDAINEENVARLVGGADIIVDCLDNFATRYILNEATVGLGVPLVHGSVLGLEGRLSFFRPPETPCLRCLFPEGPPKAVFPVVGVTPGVIGALEALEALKFLTGIGSNLKGRLLVWDGSAMTFKTFPISKDPNCPVCAKGKSGHG